MAQRRKDPSDKSPIGLKNVGNTCYFNSLLQTIFMLPNLTRKILVSTPIPKHFPPGYQR